MPCEKNVTVKLNSVIENLDADGLSGNDVEKDALEACGSLRKENGKISFSYEENREGGRILCRVDETDSGLRITRSGAVECEMIFEKGKLSRGLYKVGPFSFDMEIKTQRLENSVTENGGEVNLIYEMTVGGAKKHCRMKITILPK